MKRPQRSLHRRKGIKGDSLNPWSQFGRFHEGWLDEDRKFVLSTIDFEEYPTHTNGAAIGDLDGDLGWVHPQDRSWDRKWSRLGLRRGSKFDFQCDLPILLEFRKDLEFDHEVRRSRDALPRGNGAGALLRVKTVW